MSQTYGHILFGSDKVLLFFEILKIVTCAGVQSATCKAFSTIKLFASKVIADEAMIPRRFGKLMAQLPIDMAFAGYGRDNTIHV